MITQESLKKIVAEKNDYKNKLDIAIKSIGNYKKENDVLKDEILKLKSEIDRLNNLVESLNNLNNNKDEIINKLKETSLSETQSDVVENNVTDDTDVEKTKKTSKRNKNKTEE